MKEVLRVSLPLKKAKMVRRLAMARFGYRKGAISKAVNMALDDWLAKPVKQKKKAKPDWKKLKGVLKNLKTSSVELQHNAFSFSLEK